MSTGSPRATVLLCTYNDEQTIAAALDSALAQTAPRSSYRLLVVDDGSSDGTPEVLRRYEGEEGFSCHTLPENRGLAAACNEGLARIETPCYLRLDGDDLCEPGLLQGLLGAADGAELVYTDRWELYPSGERRRRDLSGPLRVGELIASGVLFDTALVSELGGYRPLFWEEYDLFMRLLESGRCRTRHVPEPLYTYRVEAEGRMTSDPGALAAGWRELREAWPAETLARYGLDSAEGVPGRSSVA